jgi:hypothetical protein
MSPERVRGIGTLVGYGLTVTTHVPNVIRILMIALGCGYAAVGVYGLVKFGGQLLSPPDEKHRAVRLSGLLFFVRPVGIGAGYILFGLTGSWVALALAVAFSLAEGPILRWAGRQLRQSAD